MLYFTVPVLNSYLEFCGLRPLAGERYEDNPAGSGFDYPVIRSVSAVATSASGLRPFPGVANQIYAQNEKRIEAAREALLSSVRKRLGELNAKHARIGVFGAGPHTMELLGLLDDVGVRWLKIFDNNPQKQGKHMRGIPIVKPDVETVGTVDCILISSAEFEKEMISQAQELGREQLEIIAIYNANG